MDEDLPEFPAILYGKIIQSGKTRTVSGTYIESQDLVTNRYFQKLTDEETVLWSFRFQLDTLDAVVFDNFFTHTIDRGNMFFTMAIKTEQGLIDHEVHFTQRGIPNRVTEQGGTFVYQCEVYARQIQRPISSESDIADLNCAIMDGLTVAGIVATDYAVNRDWPEALQGFISVQGDMICINDNPLTIPLV